MVLSPVDAGIAAGGAAVAYAALALCSHWCSRRGETRRLTFIADAVLALGNGAAIVACALYLRAAPGGGLWLPVFVCWATIGVAVNAVALARMRALAITDAVADGRVATDSIDSFSMHNPMVAETGAVGDVTGRFRRWDREYRCPSEAVFGACALLNLRAVAALVSHTVPFGARGIRAALAAPVRAELVRLMLQAASVLELVIHSGSCAIVGAAGLEDADVGVRVFLRPALFAKVAVDAAIVLLSLMTLLTTRENSVPQRQTSVITMLRMGPVVLGEDGYQHDLLLEPRHTVLTCNCWCCPRHRPIEATQFAEWQRRAL